MNAVLLCIEAFGASRMKKINELPDRYGGKEVVLRANAERRMSKPLSSNSIYMLDDNGHQLPMLSQVDYERKGTRCFGVKVVAYIDPQ